MKLESDVHLDPTLLLNERDWDEIATRKKSHKSFVLVYMVPYQESVYEKAKRIAADNNLDIYIVCKSIKPNKGKYKGTSNVEDIVSLFRDADYVVTNSFHGTAFSIIFQKKFLVVLNNKWGYNIRSAQLIESCKIADLSGHPELIECFDVNWEKVALVLENERRRVKAYFSEIISEKTRNN